MTAVESLDDVGDALVAQGVAADRQSGIDAFLVALRGNLEHQPLIDPGAAVTVHGVVEDRVVVSWEAVLTTGGESAQARCLTLDVQGVVSCVRFPDEKVGLSSMAEGSGSADYASLVPPETAWVVLSINGEVQEWQLPRAGAVAFIGVPFSPGDAVRAELYAADGSLIRFDDVELEPIPPFDITDEELALVIPTWPNLTGLGQTDPEVWLVRLNRSCSEGAWDHDVARALADEFIDEDMPLSLRVDGSSPATADGAQALWLMARNVCGEAFPPGVIEQGPPIAGG